MTRRADWCRDAMGRGSSTANRIFLPPRFHRAPTFSSYFRGSGMSCQRRGTACSPPILAMPIYGIPWRYPPVFRAGKWMALLRSTTLAPCTISLSSCARIADLPSVRSFAWRNHARNVRACSRTMRGLLPGSRAFAATRASPSVALHARAAPAGRYARAGHAPDTGNARTGPGEVSACIGDRSLLARSGPRTVDRGGSTFPRRVLPIPGGASANSRDPRLE